MAWEALTATHFLAASFMFLLAGWLLWLNFESRINRGFALFLFLRGMVIVCHRMGGLFPEAAEYWSGLSGYFLLAAPPALGYFLLVYRWRDRTWRHAAAVGLIVAAAVCVEWLYAVDHCLAQCREPDGRLRLGVLSLVAYGLTPLYAVAGILLARESAHALEPARRSAAGLVACAFLLQAVLEASIVAGMVLGGAWSFVQATVAGGWAAPAYALRASALPAAAVGLWVLIRSAGGLPSTPGSRIGLLGVAAAASGLYQAILPVRAPGLALSATFLTGLWLLLLPSLATYALVRHRLFDAEVKLRWTISRGAVAFLFFAAFFVGAEIAQAYVDENYGWIGGGVITGILLLALTPLHKLGDRLAEGVMPGSKPASTLSHPERLDLYRAQAALAWSDGALARKERFLLDSLRERLGISADEAMRLEREVVGAAPG